MSTCKAVLTICLFFTTCGGEGCGGGVSVVFICNLFALACLVVVTTGADVEGTTGVT